jgi:hypothetical protein
MSLPVFDYTLSLACFPLEMGSMVSEKKGT